MESEIQGQRTAPILKIHFEFGDFKGDLEGEVDDVVKGLLKQLSNVFPALELARKLTFNPDISELSSSLVGLVQFAPDSLILNAKELPADQAMLVSLLGIYIGYRLGKVQSDSLTEVGLAKVTGKALKTVSNQIAWMVDDGLVERVGRGEYRITSLGIKHAQEIIAELKERGAT